MSAVGLSADDVRDRLANAQAVLDRLDNVLARGSDLQHAANAVLIAARKSTTNYAKRGRTRPSMRRPRTACWRGSRN